MLSRMVTADAKASQRLSLPRKRGGTNSPVSRSGVIRCVRFSMPTLNRRQFSLLAAGALATDLKVFAQATPWAGEKVVDCHHHLRRDNAANIAHLDGCG